MVSRIYTPLIAPYQRSQNAGNGRGPIPADAEPKPGWAPASNEPTDTVSAGQSASGLKAVQYNQFQKIPLNDVIHDFRNTMTALGADENTQQEVSAYLNVVRYQAGKDQPEVGFIKHSLRTAANTLDQYIGKALGQPSKVVREWVDALLTQDIDYKADISAEETTVATQKPLHEETAGQNLTDASAEVLEADGLGLKISAKSELKSLIEAAKAEQQQKHYDRADEKLQAALDLLADKNKPEWAGKVWGLRGKIYDQAGHWEKAVHAYDQAAQQFEQAALPLKQSNALHAMASILEDHGDSQRAKGYYQQVAALDALHADPQTQLRSLNDLGSIALRTGDTTEAIKALQQAASLMPTQTIPPGVRSDLQTNLGAAYRKNREYPKAIASYQQSLGAAKQAKDKARYTSALQQLASVYVEANQPENAMKAMQRLKQLG
ncbi:tetratricopeptide repeat protein [Vampirovibrio sp.]|uniref:tetratricopeptide repeat protein n=1 Tax=Vampirovibrio sp. TaxID=2717857 RepID=UPI003593DA8E